MPSSDLLNVIIFSKDRACQLDLLLRSFFDSCKEASEPGKVAVSVIWLATNESFTSGYSKLKEKMPQVNWCQQTPSFRLDVLECLKTNAPLTMFLVDDDVFIDKFSLEDKQVKMLQSYAGIVTTSLRLWAGSNYCYPINKAQTVPSFVKDCVWAWSGQEGDWGYPMSVDGNIYKTDFVKEACQTTSYRNPNEFEAALMGYEPKPTHMVCYREGSKLLNVPANLVQDVFANRHSNKFSVEFLNQQYLEGKVISLENITGLKPHTPHYELEYLFIEAPK